MNRAVRWLTLTLGAIALLIIGFSVGAAVEGDDEAEHTAAEALRASEIGDAAAGRELYVSKGCAMCHRFEGEGGTDAPALDFMRGKLAATDIAAMSGVIWNHLPAMQDAFREEGIPFPTFAPGEMEDLIAYLHGGGPPPDVGEIHEEEGEEMGQAEGEEGPE